jgi:hypothetical protein
MPSFGGMGAKWKRSFNLKGTKFGNNLLTVDKILENPLLI